MFKLRRSNEPIAARPLFMVIYGLPGVGKTTLSFTAKKPVLHIDFDRGLDRAHNAARSDSFAVDGLKEFFDFMMSDDFEKLIQAENYKTVVIDTVGTLLDDYATDYLVRQNPKLGNGTGGLSLRGWGALSDLFNRIRARLQNLGINILAIAHAKEHDDGEYRLAVRGSSTDILYRVADSIGYVYNRGEERVIDFRATSEHIGKSVLKQKDNYLAIPDADDEPDLYSDFLANYMELTTAAMTSLSDEQKRFQDIYNDYLERLESLDTPEGFTELIDDLAGEGNVTLQTRIKKHLAKAMKDAGFIYSKDAGKVVPKNSLEPDDDPDPENGKEPAKEPAAEKESEPEQEDERTDPSPLPKETIARIQNEFGASWIKEKANFTIADLEEFAGISKPSGMNKTDFIHKIRSFLYNQAIKDALKEQEQADANADPDPGQDEDPVKAAKQAMFED